MKKETGNWIETSGDITAIEFLDNKNYITHIPVAIRENIKAIRLIYEPNLDDTISSRYKYKNPEPLALEKENPLRDEVALEMIKLCFSSEDITKRESQEFLAEWSYKFADIMLEARKK